MKTVADLIAELQKLDPALPVLVEGYEGGYTTWSVNGKYLFVNPKPYCGEFDDAAWGNGSPKDGADGHKVFSAIVIERGES